jgi:hypothetical protein
MAAAQLTAGSVIYGEVLPCREKLTQFLQHLVEYPLHFQWSPLLQVLKKDDRGVMGMEGERN